MLQDFLKALRILRTSPGFALLAAGTLALGIGMNAALFSVVNGVLLAPLPYPNPERVISINTVFTDEKRNIARVTGGDVLDLAAEPDLFDAFGFYGNGQMGVQMQGRAEFSGVAFVTAGFLPVFNVPPLSGRWFTNSELDGAVVSQRFANRNFGSASAALGKTLSVEGKAYAISGVMGDALDFPRATDVWIAMPSQPENTNRNSYNYRAVARLKPGITPESANARLAALGSRLAADFAADNKNKSFIAVPLREQLTGNVRTTLFILMSAVALVLLIACANVANLLLARATSRSREMAVRAALGASRWRVARQLLTENLVLALLGAAAGIVLAYWCVDLLVQLAPANLPRVANVGVSAPVLMFAIGAALVSALISGLTPALQISRVDLIESLKQGGGGRGATVGGNANRMRYGLVVFEIALSVMLAIGSGLLFRTFLSLNAVELGFEKEHVLVMYAHAPAKTLQEAINATHMFQELMPQLEALPGVTSAGSAMGMPSGQYGSNGSYQVEGAAPRSSKGPQALFRLASPKYFATMSIPLIKGRDFTVRDRYDAPFVAIISEGLARQSFPDGADPIGRRIRCGLDSENWMEIVGVVRDIRSTSPAVLPEAELYMPLQQHPFMANETQIAMRVAAGVKPEALSEAARAKVRERDSSIAVRFTTLEAMVDGAIDGQRFRAFLLTAFAAIAVLLAMAGVYGAMSYVITQRIPEMGLRLALGAGPGSLLALILGRAAWLAVAGLALGLAGAVAVSRVLEGMLYGLKPVDLTTYAAVSLVVLLVTVAAALGPAWRATRLDPMMALRQE